MVNLYILLLLEKMQGYCVIYVDASIITKIRRAERAVQKTKIIAGVEKVRKTISRSPKFKSKHKKMFLFHIKTNNIWKIILLSHKAEFAPFCSLRAFLSWKAGISFEIFISVVSFAQKKTKTFPEARINYFVKSTQQRRNWRRFPTLCWCFQC